MKQIIISILIIASTLFAQQCPDEFSPQKFEESPAFFEDLIDDNFLNVTAFGQQQEYKKLGFVKQRNTFYKLKSFKVYKDYKYPNINGLWSYKVNKQGKVYEVNISQIESERINDTTLTDMINSDFEDVWRKWEGDAYEHYMEPEFVRFKYKNLYLSLKVYFWGVEGDSARVDKSTISYQIIDFSDEVNGYIRCLNANLKHSK